MRRGRFLHSVQWTMIAWLVSTAVLLHAQEANKINPQSIVSEPDRNHIDSDRDHIKERNDWFYRGRVVSGIRTADLRHRAYQRKLALRAQRAVVLSQTGSQLSFSSGSWIALGPVPLASDASGNGTQDYHQVAGRATAVAVDPADASGNTVFVAGAQSGIWKSINAAFPTANNVMWNPISDDQATLSIGAVAIQPANSNPATTLILAATGEADNSSDSYFGLGILRSTNGGTSWSLINSANNGAISFSGLGGTRMAFSTAATNTVVAAMATSSEGVVAGAVNSGTTPGLYTSLNAGQSWAYDTLSDPGGATDPTSATSVVYNAGAVRFFAAVRYHGFYSSPDGVNWTRLANQPGGAVLSTSACPPQSASNNYGCPIYRGEITSVCALETGTQVCNPARNEMYAWYVYLAANGTTMDGGIWQSLDGGTSWTAISEAGITNCGDPEGCGVQQGTYNLELLAVPFGTATDLYAGALNLYKCSISATLNPTCMSSPFMNLTHVYGCVPISAPAHVHPAQHAMAYMIPTYGSDSGNALLFFANDGGLYRSLDGFSGLNTGACSGTNEFEDLNQNLGSMTQFVSFSQHPTDPNTLLGGTQGNGSPTTNQATTNSSWWNVLGGDGGYNAIDPLTTSNFYASNPDIPSGGLGIQLCTSGVDCNDGGFSFVVTSNDLGGDDGAFYVPYILDPGSTTSMLVGTCRIWRGPRTGGTYTELSPNFDTLGSGSCSGSEVNQVRAIAAAGMPDSYGSSIIYATTSGLGPIEGPLANPSGGHVWVTTNATGGMAYFADATDNGPQGSINPNQYPISGAATDSSDATGDTAYVTVMGFTGGSGHVWKTTNAGSTWIDFTGNLPDSPANAVVVYPPMKQVFVATDVGVFTSPTSSPNWIELGPNPNTDQAGFLPNVAVTALGIFNSGQQLLRASTYGRGIWQFNLVITPDFNLSVSNSPLTVFMGQTATFNGNISALNGYTNTVTLSCSSGTTAPPSTCTPSPSTLTPGNKTPFTVTAGGAAQDYSFNVKASGSDSSHVTHVVPVLLHVLNFGMTAPSPASVTVPRGTTSSPVSFQITAAGSFNQSVNVSCTSVIAGAACSLTPGPTVNPTSGSPVSMTASVEVPLDTIPGTYPITLQASTTGAPAPLTKSFNLVVTSNPDFVLSLPDPSHPFPEIKVGSTGTTGSISISSQDGFSGTVTLACPTTYGAGSCSISPTSVSSFPATATLTINGTSFTAGSYSLSITGTSRSTVHSQAVAFNVGDYTISGPKNLTGTPGAQVQASLILTSTYSYVGSISATCDVSALAGAVCSVSTPNTVTSGGTANLTVTISIPNSATPGAFSIKIDSHDSSGAPSHSTTLTLTLAQDFSVTSGTTAQTVTAGQTSGPYALTVQPVGTSFTGAVNLACTQGLPAGAQCSFNPSGAITPGNSAVDVVMSISTANMSTNGSHRKPNPLSTTIFLLLPGIVIGASAFGKQTKRAFRWFVAAGVISLLILLLGCAGASTAGGSGGTGTSNPVTYQITVTGTSPGTAPDAGQSAMVTLVVD